MDPDAPNVLQAMMKLEQVNVRANTTNKVVLEAEKEKDDAECTKPSQCAIRVLATQISWCQAVRVLIRPLGQKTSGSSKGPNLARGRACG
jgi:hypothetical protein